MLLTCLSNRFQTGFDSDTCLVGSWKGFEKSRPTQGYMAVVTCTTSGSGCDNFIGIRVYGF